MVSPFRRPTGRRDPRTFTRWTLRSQGNLSPIETRPLVFALAALAFYLLLHFGASPLGQSLDGNLPFASHAGPIVPGPVVSVTATSLRFDGAAMEGPDALRVRLRETRGAFAALHPGETFVGAYVLMVDREVPWRRVAPLLRAASASGYELPQLAAYRGAGLLFDRANHASATP